MDAAHIEATPLPTTSFAPRGGGSLDQALRVEGLRVMVDGRSALITNFWIVSAMVSFDVCVIIMYD